MFFTSFLSQFVPSKAFGEVSPPDSSARPGVLFTGARAGGQTWVDSLNPISFSSAGIEGSK